MHFETGSTIAAWLSGVARGVTPDGPHHLAQLAAAPGGLDALYVAAEVRGVHLVIYTDDHGDELVLASASPFRVFC